MRVPGNALPYLVENMIVPLLADGDKPITVELPLFIEAGNVLRIDTRTGRYIERA